MKLNDEPVWIEIPSEGNLLKNGLNKNELRDGGNFVHCLKNELTE
jgi:hypothetical protein